MGWRDLLKEDEEKILTAPWIKGRSLHVKNRTWKIKGRLPTDPGWYQFETGVRDAKVAQWTPIENAIHENENIFIQTYLGYLVGDRFVSDDIKTKLSIQAIGNELEQVYLIESGIDRFARIKVGRTFQNGPIIFIGEEFPIGPETDVMNAYLDNKRNVNDIAGVTPALDCAFRFETHIRAEVERRRRQEEERRLREEEERRKREEKDRLRAEMRGRLGDGQLRRQLARHSFEEAARAALAVGGAQYLDSRKGYNDEEMVVRYRLDGRRLECVCDRNSLRIIDSGICLTAHDNIDGFNYGVRGDTWFTLESLPGVIKQADREGRLVVYRHG